jgi:DNA-directed RNA polymerase sigma subunit (sigma70/sigma32)
MAQKDLRKVAAEATKVDKARERLHRAILAARRSGETYADIAPYAGLSRSRVEQIVKQAERELGGSG